MYEPGERPMPVSVTRNTRLPRPLLPLPPALGGETPALGGETPALGGETPMQTWSASADDKTWLTPGLLVLAASVELRILAGAGAAQEWATLRRMVPPDGVNLAALVQTLRMICCKRLVSARMTLGMCAGRSVTISRVWRRCSPALSVEMCALCSSNWGRREGTAPQVSAAAGQSEGTSAHRVTRGRTTASQKCCSMGS